MADLLSRDMLIGFTMAGLSIWKLIDIAIWIANHLSWNWT